MNLRGADTSVCKIRAIQITVSGRTEAEDRTSPGTSLIPSDELLLIRRMRLLIFMASVPHIIAAQRVFYGTE